MKHITITFLLCLLLFSPNLFAQEEMQISKNAVELDVLNFEQFYNLNYERAFIKNRWAIIPKAGIYIHPIPKAQSYGYQSTVGGETQRVSKSLNAVNIGVDFLYGQRKHFLRFGINSSIGGGYLRSDKGTGKPTNVLNYAIQPAIGYRFQKNEKGLFFTSSLRPYMLSIDAVRNQSGNKVRIYKSEFREGYRNLMPSFGLGYSF